MQTIVLILIASVFVLGAFRLQKRSFKSSGWVSLGFAAAAGLLLLGTAIPGWLSGLSGGWTALFGVAFLAALIIAGIDLMDKRPEKPAIIAVIVLPMLLMVGANSIGVVQNMLGDGASKIEAKIGGGS